MFELLPEDLQRVVVRFLPRNDTAQLLHDMAGKLSLKYVRQFQLDWHLGHFWELRPSLLRSIYYGSIESPLRIIRTKISQKEKILLSEQNIII